MDRQCDHCGTTYAVPSNNPTRSKFCSYRCKKKAKHQRSLSPAEMKRKETAAANRAKRAADRPKRQRSTKNRILMRTYGISIEQYERMAAEQNNRCAICQSDSTGHPTRGWSVDHCHSTNTVRGLLCFNCNTALGKMKDDVDLLQRAIDYLTRAKGNNLNNFENTSNDFCNPTQVARA